MDNSKNNVKSDLDELLIETRRLYTERAVGNKAITQHCIVLDVDDTLLQTYLEISDLRKLKIFEKSTPECTLLRERILTLEIEDVSEVKGQGDDLHVFSLLRPGLRQFLEFCGLYFKTVMIWSAGMTPYVHAVVDELFKDIPNPRLVFSRKDCDKPKEDFIKPLKKITDLYPDLSIEHIFALDDRPEVFAGNRLNLITIPEYRPEATLEDFARQDICFTRLIEWFLQPHVIQAEDVRTLEKKKIFK